jgi:replication factor A1
MKLPYDQIIAAIKEQSKLSDEELTSRIKAKMDQLSGLISKEGAAHIIANELGVNLFANSSVKIRDLNPHMKSATITGKVIAVYEIKEFMRKEGSPGKVASFMIADETARMRAVLWNDQTELIKTLKEGMIVQIKDGYIKENNMSVELHLNSRSQLVCNPEGQIINVISSPSAPKQAAVRKKIEELAQTDTNIELLGTIVQAFDPRFFEVCPECAKRLKQKDASFVCDTHGQMPPAFSYVMNATLDDGTGTIRMVFFGRQLDNLLKGVDMLKFKENPAEFQSVKQDLLGKIIKVVGRSSKNQMFDRLEFVAQLVFADPNPDEELKRLTEEAKVIE